ncbi:dTDP-4-dehydrorhamnose 3,5-epimerase [Sphingosinicella sp. BN140058]|uniref:dTDP-4-dehydrorhamnose 3,5-epimerase n=1 Tax=Sphingosinicella sp. BN140058 TaxID=1892855 RepID=UPI001010109E|nr:dTDP-4-dehydrorhamnose 3,5-epimerase [Sphingosinicella sp. BN140058]QAY75712.1 dTDP-4-dehydrorhamnose 3,5-epimerase [Sphingosinicella sp. BN140058]
MKVADAGLSGLKLIEPRRFEDERGFFFESWNRRTFEEQGIDAEFVQDNHSGSAKGVLRGLHYQLTRPQGKLVRVVRGAAFDVALDIRTSSATFGRWIGFVLSADNGRMLWVPPGFAHGFLSLEDGTELLYKCTDFYAPKDERSILWSDPAVGIDWPLPDTAAPLLAAKDRSAPLLRDAEVYS